MSKYPRPEVVQPRPELAIPEPFLHKIDARVRYAKGRSGRRAAATSAVLRQAEVSVLRAEHTALPGGDKKALVIDAMLEFVEHLEKKHDLVPRWSQGPVFWALRKAVPYLVEQAVANLKARGAL